MTNECFTRAPHRRRPQFRDELQDAAAAQSPETNAEDTHRRRCRLRAGVRLIPEGRPANRSLSAIEPVSATAKRKLENGEQRPPPETFPARAEIAEASERQSQSRAGGAHRREMAPRAAAPPNILQSRRGQRGDRRTPEAAQRRASNPAARRDAPAIAGGGRPPGVEAFCRALRWVDDIWLGRIASIAGIAERESQGERHIRLLAPLAFLSPRIIAAIVDGTAPADLTVTGLAKALPYSWAEQEQSIGL
jgi:hypothetical protein